LNHVVDFRREARGGVVHGPAIAFGFDVVSRCHVSSCLGQSVTFRRVGFLRFQCALQQRRGICIDKRRVRKRGKCVAVGSNVPLALDVLALQRQAVLVLKTPAGGVFNPDIVEPFRTIFKPNPNNGTLGVEQQVCFAPELTALALQRARRKFTLRTLEDPPQDPIWRHPDNSARYELDALQSTTARLSQSRPP
jgi:hypothetical protein